MTQEKMYGGNSNHQTKPAAGQTQFPKKNYENGASSSTNTTWPGFHNLLGESKLRITAEKDPSLTYTRNGAPSSMCPKLEGTNPRFTVYPNIEGYEEPITVRLDPILAELYLDLIIEAANSAPGFRQQFITKNWDPEAKKVYDEARSTIGRQRENGVVYIKIKSLVDDNIPEITFTFAARSFLSVIQGDGIPIPPGDFSCGYARGWANKLKRLFDIAQSTMPKMQRKPWDGNKTNNATAQGSTAVSSTASSYQKPAYTGGTSNQQTTQRSQYQPDQARKSYINTATEASDLDEDIPF